MAGRLECLVSMAGLRSTADRCSEPRTEGVRRNRGGRPPLAGGEKRRRCRSQRVTDRNLWRGGAGRSATTVGGFRRDKERFCTEFRGLFLPAPEGQHLNSSGWNAEHRPGQALDSEGVSREGLRTIRPSQGRKATRAPSPRVARTAIQVASLRVDPRPSDSRSSPEFREEPTESSAPSDGLSLAPSRSLPVPATTPRV